MASMFERDDAGFTEDYDPNAEPGATAEVTVTRRRRRAEPRTKRPARPKKPRLFRPTKRKRAVGVFPGGLFRGPNQFGAFARSARRIATAPTRNAAPSSPVMQSTSVGPAEEELIMENRDNQNRDVSKTVQAQQPQSERTQQPEQAQQGSSDRPAQPSVAGPQTGPDARPRHRRPSRQPKLGQADYGSERQSDTLTGERGDGETGQGSDIEGASADQSGGSFLGTRGDDRHQQRIDRGRQRLRARRPGRPGISRYRTMTGRAAITGARPFLCMLGPREEGGFALDRPGEARPRTGSPRCSA